MIKKNIDYLSSYCDIINFFYRGTYTYKYNANLTYRHGINMLQLAILPIQQTFGLIFRERFFSLGITATQTSLIVHLNGTITCSLGLISGPMMKRFTFRKVAFLGGFIVIVGICAAAYAISLPSIIITYCIIVGE